MSWSQVLQLGEPVVGDVEDYESARAEAASSLSAFEGVRDQFKRIEATGVLELQGRAAGELGEVIRGVDGCLCDLPVVMGDVEAILGAHARRLEVLKQRADEALARAQARWDRLQSALQKEHAADSRLRFLRSQQRSLGSLGVSDEHAAAESARLASAISTQWARVSDRRRATADARDELGLSRSEHAGLQEDEQALVNQTVAALGGIDLRSLKDPAWLQKVGGWLIDAHAGHLRASWWLGGAIADGVAGWFGDGFSDFWKMGGALWVGDFNAALWYLQDVLDKATLALAVAGLAAILFLSGGTATPVVVTAIAVLAGVSAVGEAASAWYLYANQAPHPETGERMTLTHAILDTIGVGAAAATFGGSRFFTSYLKRLPAGTFDVDRPLLPVLVNLKLLRKLDDLHGAARMAHENRIVRELQQRAVESIDGLVELATPGAAFAAGTTKRAADAATRYWHGARRAAETGVDVGGQALDLGKEAIGVGVDFVGDVGGQAVDVGKEAGDSIADAAVRYWDGTRRAAETGVDVGGQALDLGKEAIDVGVDFVGDVGGQALDLGKEAIDVGVDFVGDVGGQALDFGKEAIDVGADFVGGVGHGARRAAETGVDVGGDVAGQALDFGKEAIDVGVDVGGQALDFGFDFVKWRLNNLVDFFGGSGGQVSSLGEFCAFGPSLQDGSTSFQLAQR